MATQYVYPVATTTFEWTPSSGGDDHHLLLDEVTPNETDTISVGGFSGGKMERLTYGKGTAGTVVKVTAFRVSIHLNSTSIANAPAMRVKHYFNAGLIDDRSFDCSSGGSYDDFEYTIGNLNIAGSEWDAFDMEIELLPIDGNAGYSPSE